MFGSYSHTRLSSGGMQPVGTRMVRGMPIPTLVVAQPWQKAEACEMLGLDLESGRQLGCVLENAADSAAEMWESCSSGSSSSGEDDGHTEEVQQYCADKGSSCREADLGQPPTAQGVTERGPGLPETNSKREDDLYLEMVETVLKLDDYNKRVVSIGTKLMHEAKAKAQGYLSKLAQKLPADYPHIFAKKSKWSVKLLQQEFRCVHCIGWNTCVLWMELLDWWI